MTDPRTPSGPRPPAPDFRSCNAEGEELFTEFFRTKGTHDADATMQLMSPDLDVYADVALGWELEGHSGLQEVWAQYMPMWGEGLSYPTSVLGEVRDGEGSALVYFTDTAELFGAEMRIAAAVDVREGKITRWADYWDSANYPHETYTALKRPEPAVPLALRAAPAVVDAGFAEIVARLADAIAAGDTDTVAGLSSFDLTYADRAVRVRVEGRDAVVRYLGRSVPENPFGTGLRRGHTVGGSRGGGFEWGAREGHAVHNGITSVTLGRGGLVTDITTTWDSRNLTDRQRHHLASLGVDDLAG